MTMKVTAKEARRKFSDMLNTAVFGKKNIIVTRFNKPAAVLIDYEQYERLMDPRARFTKKEWDKGFEVFDNTRANAKNLSTREIERIVNKNVDAVRKERRKTSRRR